MQPRVIIFSLLYQLDKSCENPLLVHHIEGSLILPAIKEQERNDEVEGIDRVFLWRIVSSVVIGASAAYLPVEGYR